MNLYVHFPFCRAKCAYCALLSRAGSTPAIRAAHVARLVREMEALDVPPDPFHTIYFGGGSPAMADLAPLFAILRRKGLLDASYEFTVELHPLDVTPGLVNALRAGGVNRVSLGVQSFDDPTLALVNRRHTSAAAHAALRLLGDSFPSVGLDLIAGLPRPDGVLPPPPDFTAFPFLTHASVYTLIREPHTRLDLDVTRGRYALPGDEDALAEAAVLRDALGKIGLVRYEISNCARPGFECRHNFAVWRGEDYVGLGEGACGRVGPNRTTGMADGYRTETLAPEADALERALFALRTSDGFSPALACSRWPVLAPRRTVWEKVLTYNRDQGLLAEKDGIYRLTPRGADVCDAILADLV